MQSSPGWEKDRAAAPGEERPEQNEVAYTQPSRTPRTTCTEGRVPPGVTNEEIKQPCSRQEA